MHRMIKRISVAGILVFSLMPALSAQNDPAAGGGFGAAGNPNPNVGVLRRRPPAAPAPGAGAERLVMPPQPFEMARIADQLQLSQEVKDSISALVRKHGEEVKPVNEQLQAQYKELLAVMTSSSPDADKAGSILTDIFTARKNIATKGLTFWIEVRKLLTAEQNEKLSQIVKDRSARSIGFGALRQGGNRGMINRPPGQGPDPGFGAPPQEQGNPAPPMQGPEPDPGQ